MDRAEKPGLVMTVLAHPDDMEILVGGTLLHLKERGWELVVVTMTAGDCGSCTHTREEISRIRFEEAREAARHLGAEFACVGLHDIEIFLEAESLRRTVEVLRRFAPDVVITHSPADYMVDHEETSRLVRSAAFAAPMPLYQTRQVPPAPAAGGTPALYYADPVEGLDPLGRRVLPDFYVDVGSRMEEKRKLLAFHQSQRGWLRAHHGIDEYLHRMTAWAEAYGKESGFEYAEGFRQHRGHGYPTRPVLQEAMAGVVRRTGEGH